MEKYLLQLINHDVQEIFFLKKIKALLRVLISRHLLCFHQLSYSDLLWAKQDIQD